MMLFELHKLSKLIWKKKKCDYKSWKYFFHFHYVNLNCFWVFFSFILDLKQLSSKTGSSLFYRVSSGLRDAPDDICEFGVFKRFALRFVILVSELGFCSDLELQHHKGVHLSNKPSRRVKLSMATSSCKCARVRV